MHVVYQVYVVSFVFFCEWSRVLVCFMLCCVRLRVSSPRSSILVSDAFCFLVVSASWQMSAWLGIRPLGQSAGDEFPKVFPHNIKAEVGEALSRVRSPHASFIHFVRRPVPFCGCTLNNLEPVWVVPYPAGGFGVNRLFCSCAC